jgi:hypothetical protein
MIPTELLCTCIVPITMLFVTYDKAWAKKMYRPSIVFTESIGFPVECKSIFRYTLYHFVILPPIIFICCSVLEGTV